LWIASYCGARARAKGFPARAHAGPVGEDGT
jgi:hypothetical protein